MESPKSDEPKLKINYLTGLRRHDSDRGRAASIAIPLHRRQSSLNQMKSPDQIDIDHKPDLLQVLIHELLRSENALITDEDIDRPRSVNRILNSIKIPSIGTKNGYIDAGSEANRFPGLVELGLATGED